jgi:putative heme iron utilization protein
VSEKRDVIRQTDAASIRLARTLLRTARHGAAATLDPHTGAPLASRVGVATDIDGAPVILVSLLAAHTGAILADPRCSLLVGEPGKGDALAHPRLSVACRARLLDPGTGDHDRAQRRYLARNPKAALYAGLGDFHLFRLEPDSASLNGGFGKAYSLTRDDLLSDAAVSQALAEVEAGAVAHMNADHRDAIDLYARHFARATDTGWSMTGIDPDGFDLVRGDAAARVDFLEPLGDAGDMRKALVAMAQQARAAQAAG